MGIVDYYMNYFCLVGNWVFWLLIYVLIYNNMYGLKDKKLVYWEFIFL